jgi:hypothetical protein
MGRPIAFNDVDAAERWIKAAFAVWEASLLRTIAESYLTGQSDDELLATILLPAGTRAVYVAAPDLVVEKHELELLLPRSSKFQILRTHLHPGQTPSRTLDLELIS